MPYVSNKTLDSDSYIKELAKIFGDEHFQRGMSLYQIYASKGISYRDMIRTLRSIKKKDAGLLILGWATSYMGNMGRTIETNLALKTAFESGILENVNEEILNDIIHHSSEIGAERQGRAELYNEIKNNHSEFDLDEFLKKLDIKI